MRLLTYLNFVGDILINLYYYIDKESLRENDNKDSKMYGIFLVRKT